MLPETPGYDGQFFFTLAHDPLLKHPSTLSHLDDPKYRARRILLPGLGFLLALGQPELIPYTLALVNLLSWLLVGWVLVSRLSNAGLPVSLAVLGFCNLGVLYATGLSTSEVLAAALLLAGYECYQRQWLWSGLALLALAPLARETALVGVIAWGAAWIYQKNSKNLGLSLLIPVPLLSWVAYVGHQVQGTGGRSGWHNFTWSLMGMQQKVLSLFEAPSPKEIIALLMLIAVCSGFLWKAFRLLRRDPFLGMITGSHAAMFLLSGDQILEVAQGYSRIYWILFPCYVVSLSSAPSGLKQRLLGRFSSRNQPRFLGSNNFAAASRRA